MAGSLSHYRIGLILSQKLSSFKEREYQVNSFTLSIKEINSDSIELSGMHFCLAVFQATGTLQKYII